jgi:hypothetical protein
MTWKLVQAAVQKPKPVITGTCFIRLKKTDKDKIANQPVVESAAAVNVMDSDGEEDEDVERPEPAAAEPEKATPQEEVEVVVAPPPIQETVVQKKKVGGKKKE